MPRGSAPFLLGFGFGVVTLSAFRHELHLTGDLELMALFLIYGIAMVAVVTAWYRRVVKRTAAKFEVSVLRPTTEWGLFIWGTLFLFASYFALLLMVADF